MKATPNHTQPCSVEGCDREQIARGFCHRHYNRWWEHGDPGEAAIRVYDPPGACAVVACDRRTVARGLCSGHYSRWQVTGDPGDTPLRPRGPHTYGTAHDRVYAVRGKASAHPCAHCGETAAHWAYDHRDPDVRMGTNGGRGPLAYSADPDHYLPLCVPCHQKLDKSVRLAP